MAKFALKPSAPSRVPQNLAPKITGELPQLAAPSGPSSPEEFIKGAAVVTKQAHTTPPDGYPWASPYLKEHPELSRMQSYRLRETLIQKLDYLSTVTRIPRAQLVAEGIQSVIEKRFAALGIPFSKE